LALGVEGADFGRCFIVGEERGGCEVVFEGGGFDVFLVAAGDLACVAVGVEVLEVRGDGGVVGRDGGVVGGVGFGDVRG
jgi:hypothetical protein